MKYFALISTLVLGSLFCQSCRQGCTDPAAYNYKRSAKIDDAGCLYCDSIVFVNTNSIDIYDNNPGDSYYGQFIYTLTINSRDITYSGNGCSIRGRDQGCYNSYYTAVLKNEFARTAILYGTIQIIKDGGSTILSVPVSGISVPSGSTATIDLGYGGCHATENFSVGLSNQTIICQ